MIRRKPEPTPILHLSTSSPETSPRSSIVISDWDADDEDTMSMEDVIPSRPSSIKNGEEGYGYNVLHNLERPTLPEVLSNSAPPPWTLSAFTAYLSQNHCLENLEFTMDAERYRDSFDALVAQTAGMPISSDIPECKYIRMRWQRLLDAYIEPDGPREINIPSNVRHYLLSIPNDIAPPSPEELKAAVKIIYNLMEESVLVAFLNDVPSFTTVKPNPERRKAPLIISRKRGGSDSSNEKKSSRSKSRGRASPTSSFDSPFSYSDPTGRLTPAAKTHAGFAKGARAPGHTSSGSGDPGLVTDDSGSASSPGRDPLTPPTTPPSSDFGGSSPRSRNDNTWKKMLGWKKKSSNGMRDNRFPTVED